MSTTLADVLYPGGVHVPGGPEPQSPPSDLTPNSPIGSSPGSDEDGGGASRKRSASGSAKESKERTANKICRVCGDKAYSYNFNVITCESCKAFFRRNANKEKEIRCPFNESCEINVVSRRFCQRCRLHKCFQVGMKREWIMTDEARLEKKARVEENRERRKEEAKKKDDGPSSHHGHHRTTSVSSGSGRGAAATDAAAAAASFDFDTSPPQQPLQPLQQVQMQQPMQPQQHMMQPELPTVPLSLATTAATTTQLLDALAQQSAAVAAAVQQQQHQPMQQAFPAALVAAAVVQPQQTNTEMVAQAIALEQIQQQQAAAAAAVAAAPYHPTAATDAAAVYQAAAAHHHQQQQQQMAAAAVVAQQIASLAVGPSTPFVDATVAAALALPAQPMLNAADAFNQAALIMDASAAAASQQLQLQQLAAAPPPPSAMAAVASTLLQQQPLLQPSVPPLPDRCSCSCKCGKYHGGRSIVEQAQEEWEAERRGRRSNSSAGSHELGLSELLPGASNVNWLNPATNQNPLTEGALSTMAPTMTVDEAYGDLRELKDSFLRNPLCPPTQQALGLRSVVDPEFGPMEAEDEERLRFVHSANAVWSQPLDQAENKLHSQSLPSKMDMLEMMVGAVKRMILMAKKFPALKALHSTDQMKLISSCYLDVMIIRGAMAYDPNENAWKGPTSKSGYSIKLDAMNDKNDSANNMFHQSIRLYTMFKEEYRQNESVMLLLNMIVLFDPTVADVMAVGAVRAEQNAYKRCLKRLMWTMLDKNQSRVQLEYKSLLDRLATVRKMNSGARGIMEEHADGINPLLKELLNRPDNDTAGTKKPSPKHQALQQSPPGTSAGPKS
ncbi:hypothetical protein PFISCL1PPCAC_29149 [Pristionchus fissidentatus]|uniref:Uncharacterized protein n=1 Tax=Pristionchus fissidentatus TaxID=1538716 RepID=A0AAV5WN77_9BILA|nr:hypothetical protein PFISCL1PPCAC_22491 [Pristionchus fissidentatus]GMT37852.1 hypothetical protein PFISCL1PPCAC_29149 [Pristionchus fissidentatus]